MSLQSTQERKAALRTRVYVWLPGASAAVTSSEIAFSQTAAIRVMQNATLNADASTANRLHDNTAGIDGDK